MMYFSLAGFCFFILLSSLGFEYLLALPPCMLCVYARVIIGVLSLLFLLLAKAKKHRRILFGATLLTLIGGLGLSIFHSALERGWVTAPFSCTSSKLKNDAGIPLTTQELRECLLDSPISRCDRISWSLGGLSLANYNGFLFTGFIVLLLIYRRRYDKKS